MLGRHQVAPDDKLLSLSLVNKQVMVTGAGGSIGSELCRQIVAFKPDHLVFLELTEFALYAIQEEFSSSFPGIKMSFVIGDINLQ